MADTREFALPGVLIGEAATRASGVRSARVGDEQTLANVEIQRAEEARRAAREALSLPLFEADVSEGLRLRRIRADLIGQLEEAAAGGASGEVFKDILARLAGLDKVSPTAEDFEMKADALVTGKLFKEGATALGGKERDIRQRGRDVALGLTTSADVAAQEETKRRATVASSRAAMLGAFEEAVSSVGEVSPEARTAVLEAIGNNDFQGVAGAVGDILSTRTPSQRLHALADVMNAWANNVGVTASKSAAVATAQKETLQQLVNAIKAATEKTRAIADLQRSDAEKEVIQKAWVEMKKAHDLVDLWASSIFGENYMSFVMEPNLPEEVPTGSFWDNPVITGWLGSKFAGWSGAGGVTIPEGVTPGELQQAIEEGRQRTQPGTPTTEEGFTTPTGPGVAGAEGVATTTTTGPLPLDKPVPDNRNLLRDQLLDLGVPPDQVEAAVNQADEVQMAEMFAVDHLPGAMSLITEMTGGDLTLIKDLLRVILGREVGVGAATTDDLLADIDEAGDGGANLVKVVRGFSPLLKRYQLFRKAVLKGDEKAAVLQRGLLVQDARNLRDDLNR